MVRISSIYQETYLFSREGWYFRHVQNIVKFVKKNPYAVSEKAKTNLTLVGYSKKRDLDYDSYEKELKEAQKWYMYQKSLTEVLYRISDLRYTLHLGAVSREQCVALLPTYSHQVEETQQRLTAWHNDTTQRLKIDTSEIRRKREGWDGIIHFIPGLFNDNFNFKAIEENTAEMIKTQSEEHHDLRKYDTSDLYSEDVQLIVKGENLYYLPSDK